MQEKFAALTPEQREKLDELKDSAKLDAFLLPILSMLKLLSKTG